MWGAVIGDIIGSAFEHANHRSPFFELFRTDCRFTDDTVCTAAIADILLRNPDLSKISEDSASNTLRLWCCTYLNRGFGSMFYQWIANAVNRPYGSYGNGSLMRISPVALFCVNRGYSREQALEVADLLTRITHNHPQALKAVKLYVGVLYDLLKYNKDNAQPMLVDDAKTLIAQSLLDMGYPQPQTIDKYRVQIDFDVTAETSLLVACTGIFESESFEDVMYKVVSVGGDSDTYAAIAGAMAEVIFGIPASIKDAVKPYFRSYDEDLLISIESLYRQIEPVELQQVESNEDKV